MFKRCLTDLIGCTYKQGVFVCITYDPKIEFDDKSYFFPVLSAFNFDHQLFQRV